MNYCPNCGKEVKKGIRFCNGCGENITAEEAQHNQTSSTVSGQVKNKVASRIDQEKIRTLSHNYFAYFKMTLFKPSESQNQKASKNGIIQFVLLTLIQVLTLWFVTVQAYNSVVSYGYGNDPIGFDLVIGLFLVLLLLNFLSVFVVFGMKKLFYKSRDSFLKTSTQYGGYFTSALVLQGVSLLLLFISVESIEYLSIFYALSFLISLYAFINYLYTTDLKSKVDKFYVGIIATIVLFLAWSIVISIGQDAVANVIDNFFYGLDLF